MLTNEQLNELLTKRAQLKRDVEMMEKEIKELNTQVQNYMDEINQEEYNSGVFKIYWRPLERKDVDKKKLEQDGLLDKYTKLTCFLRLDIR